MGTSAMSERKPGTTFDASVADAKASGRTTSYSLGNAGDIFGPSLFLGAMLGGVAYNATPGADALVGIGSVFAGMVRAPMTSVLMIFEMTQGYAVIARLMIANLVSLFVSSRLHRQPIYDACVSPEHNLAQQGGGSESRKAFGVVRLKKGVANCLLRTRGLALDFRHNRCRQICSTTGA
jgi:H+/Cl- antiporter ClcA